MCSNWDILKWAYVDRDDFVLGPLSKGNISTLMHRHILLNSMSIDMNSVLVHKNIKKKANGWFAKLNNKFNIWKI